MSVSRLHSQRQKLTNQVGKGKHRPSIVTILYTVDGEGLTEKESQAEAEQNRLKMEEAARQGITTIVYLPNVEPEE